jgi:hypothetical protein
MRSLCRTQVAYGAVVRSKRLPKSTSVGFFYRRIGTSSAITHSSSTSPLDYLEHQHPEEKTEKVRSSLSTGKPGTKRQSLSRAQDVTYTDNSSWSSPHDVVSRNAFARDHVHLWTLLETCIEVNNMTRAESILVGLSEIASDQDVTLAANNYLLKLGELNPSDPKVLHEWLGRIKIRMKNFKPNAVTYAIMLKSMYTAKDYQGIKAFVRSRRSDELSQILNRIEVLGLEALKGIVEVSTISQKTCKTR